MRLTGLLLVLLSAATFGTSGSFADSLLKTGWTPGAAVTVRICAAALMLTVPGVVLARGRWAGIRAEVRPRAGHRPGRGGGGARLLV